MTAKEYLGQARYLDDRINSKIRQMDALNVLATKCTSVITGMPHSSSGSSSRMADTIDKIIDLQDEINRDIDALVDLKRDIVGLIKRVSNPEYQTLLEARYLEYQSWNDIAALMGYEISWVHRIHGRALEEVDNLLADFQKKQ